MNLTGKLVGAAVNFKSGKVQVAFEVNEKDQVMDRFDIEKNMELDIVTSKKTKKRSLNANAYFHLLASKLADKMGTSKPWMKNRLLFLYGQREDCVLESLTSLENRLTEREDIHLWAIEEDGLKTKFAVLTPSRYLNADEFRILLDGTIEECKACDIETITPNELSHMLSLWKGERVEIDS